MTNNLFGIYGASGFGREVAPLARARLMRSEAPPDSLVFIDDNPGEKELNGHPVMAYSDFIATPAAEKFAVIAIANGNIRQSLSRKLQDHNVHPWTVIAENSVIMDAVDFGEGCVICPFVTITSNIKIGKYFHANIYSYVAHDCVIGDFVTFAPGVQCNGNVAIGDRAYIGAGAVLRQGKPGQPLRIGEGAVVGMGAVVTKDVPPGVTVVGNPARLMEKGGARG
ncbi:MAG: acetyltransferase [Rhodopseudomonas palustris]|nr:MAG: acetyltransferase [Rhodopseudomonas palustris]